MKSTDVMFARPVLKRIPGWPGYSAGSDGHIYSFRPRNHNAKAPATPRRRSEYIDPYGYTAICLSVKPNRKTFRVHRLICIAFHGLPTLGVEVCHGPRGRLDNTPENLSWGTHSKNNGEDQLRDGKDRNGERHPLHKLTLEQVMDIRSRYEQGETQRSLSREFGVCNQQISRIVSGKRWKLYTLTTKQ
jgi:hypothetical protein